MHRVIVPRSSHRPGEYPSSVPEWLEEGRSLQLAGFRGTRRWARRRDPVSRRLRQQLLCDIGVDAESRVQNTNFSHTKRTYTGDSGFVDGVLGY